jgi:hypothetical protein
MKQQHKTPCATCPFKRTAWKGFIGGVQTPKEFADLAMSEARMPCHTHLPDGVDYGQAQIPGTKEYNAPQCAGRAIYWANVAKIPRDRSLLKLPRDTATVFSWPPEFIEHHTRGGEEYANDDEADDEEYDSDEDDEDLTNIEAEI